MTDPAQVVRVYGPGGPYRPMEECAARFIERTGIAVEVTKGTPHSWIDRARRDADLIYGGAEYMLTDFVLGHPGIVDTSRIVYLYSRLIGIVVRKGNPKAIRSLDGLCRPGIRILDVKLENMEEIQTRRPGLMQNIWLSVLTGEEGADRWQTVPELDAWITYESWHIRLRGISDFVHLPENDRLLRATPIAPTFMSSEPNAAIEVVRFLESEEGHGIFRKWGWR